jgi:hypothetical protein
VASKFKRSNRPGGEELGVSLIEAKATFRNGQHVLLRVAATGGRRGCDRNRPATFLGTTRLLRFLIVRRAATTHRLGVGGLLRAATGMFAHNPFGQRTAAAGRPIGGNVRGDHRNRQERCQQATCY